MVTGLQVEQASVRYGDVVAVDDVTLRVGQGEIVALVGASGSGKSSLLRAVAGLEPLASGTIRWAGEDLAGVPVHKRGFGLMFQDGQLFPHFDVGGNVGYGLYRDERGDRDARVRSLLELVGLPGYERRRVHELSGGQAQRVALARSLAPSPRLLLLDEPLSALDRGLRERMVDVLGEGLRATGTPALYVTHDQDEAFGLADRVAVMEHGRLLQVDAPDALWRRPASRRVAEFLGYGPFVNGAAASALGYAVDPGETVAVGPAGLVHAEDGVAVPVLGVRPVRGQFQVTVRLPDGQQAILTLAQPPGTPAMRVALDPAGCALVAG